MTLDLTRRIGAFLILVGAVLFGPSLLAQVAEVVTTPPQVPDASANEWGGTILWGYFASQGMEWLKRAETVTLITPRTTAWAQRGMSLVLAMAAAIGVHYTYDSSTGVLMVTGLTLTGMWTMLTETIRQWVVMQLTYKAAVKARY